MYVRALLVMPPPQSRAMCSVVFQDPILLPSSHFRCTMSAMDRACRLFQEPGTVNEFFRRVELSLFLEDALRQLVPGFVGRWEGVAQCLSVPWPWVMTCEICLAGFLAPTAVLFLLDDM